MTSSGASVRLARTSSLLCFMLTVPFALILNSEQTVLTTQVHLDGTMLRQVNAEANSYFKRDLNKWTADVEAGSSWQRRWQKDSSTRSTTTITRNFIGSYLQPSDSGAELRIEDLAQNPLSPYTTYSWTETVNIKHLSVANPAEARAGGHYLVYHVIMPGSITDAHARPSTGPALAAPANIAGNQATVMLDAAYPEHTVTVTARRVRWGALAVVVYVTLFVLVQISGVAIRRAQSRPKRI